MTEFNIYEMSYSSNYEAHTIHLFPCMTHVLQQDFWNAQKKNPHVQTEKTKKIYVLLIRVLFYGVLVFVTKPSTPHNSPDEFFIVNSDWG